MPIFLEKSRSILLPTKPIMENCTKSSYLIEHRDFHMVADEELNKHL